MGGRKTLLFLMALGLTTSAARAVLPLQEILNFERMDAQPSVLRLYLMPTAPVKLKWGSPRALMLSALEATAFDRSHPIGHVSIEVQLRGMDDPEHHVFTGATDAESGMSRSLLLHDEMAFSILERAWAGKLENAADVAKSIVDRSGHKDRLAVATFLISDATAQRLLDYCHQLQADREPRYYGFTARPRRHEGSGCSAFGASFVELTGVMDAQLRSEWTRNVNVPLSVMAGYLGVPYISVPHTLVMGAASAWTDDKTPHMHLECFDPDPMFDWTVKLHDQPADLHGLPVHADADFPKQLDAIYHLDGVATQNVKAIVVDARDVPTPSEPIFNGPSDLQSMTDTKLPTVIRAHKQIAADGSFELRP